MLKLNDLKINKRLRMAFLICVIISSISGIIGLVLMQAIDYSYSKALVNYGFAQGEIGKFGMKLNENRAYIRDIVFLTEKSDLDAAYEKIQKNIVEIDEILAKVKETNISKESKDLFAIIENDLIDFRSTRDKVLEFGMANNQEEGYALWTNEAMPQLVKIVQDVESLMQMNSDQGTKKSTYLTITSRIMALSMILIILISFFISIRFSKKISKGISDPLDEAEKVALEVSKGNFDVNISYNNDDEIGSLCNSMNTLIDTTKTIILDISSGLKKIAEGNFDVSPKAKYIGVYTQLEISMKEIIMKLSKTMYQINQAAEQTTNSSLQVSKSSQFLSEGAVDQASAVEEILASITEVLEQVNANAKNAQKSNEITNDTKEFILYGNDQMKEMIKAMSDISDASSKISNIIRAINDIATQTNLLSLNASIEAARAGEAGKGFAVVADEVRNLATESAKAVRDTTQLIENSLSSIKNGTTVANKTAEALETIVEKSEGIIVIMAEIAKSSEEQSSVMKQINDAVEQIAGVVQSNSATAQESAAVSQEMSSQAFVLKDLIEQFTLHKDVLNQK